MKKEAIFRQLTPRQRNIMNQVIDLQIKIQFEEKKLQRQKDKESLKNKIQQL